MKLSNSISDYRIVDTDPELCPRATSFMVSPGVYRGEMHNDYVERMFNRVQEVVVTTDRGSLAYDVKRGQTILQLDINAADKWAAPILEHEKAEAVWLVLEPPNEEKDS